MSGGGLVTLGETMGRLTPTEVGPLSHVPSLRLGIAGSESNVAIGVRRLGPDATWIGRVGADEVGELIVRELRAESVTVRAARDAASTGLLLKTLRTQEVTNVTYFRAGSAGSRLCVDDVDEDAIRAAGVLHVTGITPALGEGPAAAVDAAVEVARGSGVTVSLDLNYRARLWDRATAVGVLRDLVGRADVVFAGEQEAALVVEDGTREGVVRALGALGPSQAILKCGADGCLAWVVGEYVLVPAVPVRSVDPVGAGDAFVAGYLAELLRGEPLERRLATAVAAGAFAVTVPGDWEGLPHRGELTMLHAPDPVIR